MQFTNRPPPARRAKIESPSSPADGIHVKAFVAQQFQDPRGRCRRKIRVQHRVASANGTPFPVCPWCSPCRRLPSRRPCIETSASNSIHAGNTRRAAAGSSGRNLRGVEQDDGRVIHVRVPLLSNSNTQPLGSTAPPGSCNTNHRENGFPWSSNPFAAFCSAR